MTPSEYIKKYIRPTDVSDALRRSQGNSTRDKRLIINKALEIEAVLNAKGLEVEIRFPEGNYMKCTGCGEMNPSSFEYVGCQQNCAAPWASDKSGNPILYKKETNHTYHEI